VADALKEVGKFPRRSIHHVVLSGHGSCTTLQLGEDTLEVSSSETKEFFRALMHKTKLNASITLESCSVGEQRFCGLKNLFREVSDTMSGRRVLAATRDLTKAMSSFYKQDDNACLTGDTAVSRKSEDDYVVSLAGQPRCKEFDEKDIKDNIGKVCLAQCWKTCYAALNDWHIKFPGSSIAQVVSLLSVPKLVEDRKNNCPLGVSRQVCLLRVW